MSSTSTTIVTKISLAIAGAVGASAGMLLGASEASAFSFTSPTQTGTLSSGNELVFAIDPAPVAAGDVTLDIFAFGDVDGATEYLNVFGRGTGVADWTTLDNAFDFVTSFRQYAGEVQDTLTISASDFNSWLTAGNGGIEIKLTPNSRVSNLRNNPDEYAYIALNYEESSSTPVPEPITGLVLAAAGGGAALRRAKSKKQSKQS